MKRLSCILLIFTPSPPQYFFNVKSLRCENPDVETQFYIFFRQNGSFSKLHTTCTCMAINFLIPRQSMRELISAIIAGKTQDIILLMCYSHFNPVIQGTERK